MIYEYSLVSLRHSERAACPLSFSSQRQSLLDCWYAHSLSFFLLPFTILPLYICPLIISHYGEYKIFCSQCKQVSYVSGKTLYSFSVHLYSWSQNSSCLNFSFLNANILHRFSHVLCVFLVVIFFKKTELLFALLLFMPVLNRHLSFPQMVVISHGA